MKSKWITHPLQSDWQIVNVFSRQLEQKEININPEDQNHKLTGCQLPEIPLECLSGSIPAVVIW